jgi:hypothetical protein
MMTGQIRGIWDKGDEDTNNIKDRNKWGRQ